MAVQTMTTCDFDHGAKPAEARTITFSVDGSRSTVDLCAQHEQALRRALEPFRSYGRRTARLTAAADGRRGLGGRPKAALRVADLTEAELAYARRLGWGGKRLSNEIIAKIQKRRTKAQ